MRKGIHAFTPKNDEFNSVEGRQETKGTHPSTPKNDEFNSVERREGTKETHASTPKNDEFNLIQGREKREGSRDKHRTGHPGRPVQSALQDK